MFNRIAVLLSGLGAVLLTVAAVPQLKADSMDNATVVTFSNPVEISHEVVPAGTYTFQTMRDDRNVVEVTNRDQNHLVGLFITNTAVANATPDKAEIQMTEGHSGAPPAVHTWFYPGDTIGWEFQGSQAAK